MPEERVGHPADPSSTGAQGGRTHPGGLSRLLPDGDAEASTTNACSRVDTTSGAGETGRHPNVGRIVSDDRWPPPDYAALHRTGSRTGPFTSSPEPRIAA